MEEGGSFVRSYAMSALNRKLLRDIAAGKGRFFAVAFLVFLGLALFMATWLGYRSLDHSYKTVSAKLDYNDFIIKVASAPDGITSDLQSLDGVQSVTSRLALESGCYMPGAKNVVCRLIGMPTGGQPAVNKVLVESGRYFRPGDDAACLVEAHLSDFYKVRAGAEVLVSTPEGTQQLVVVGTVASPEFFLVSTDRSPIASPSNYGILFVQQDWLQAAFGWQGSSNEFCFTVEPGADANKVMQQAEQVLAPYKVLYASLGEETESRQLMNLDVQGFQQMSVFFPVLFLVVAGLSLYMILTRIVHLQRPQIGTMMAFGVSRRSITAHYLSYAMLVGFSGAVLGLLAGYFLGGWLTATYAHSLHIPLVSSVMDWEAAAAGLIIATAACVFACVLPVRRLVRLSPAMIMSEGDARAGKSGGGESLAEKVLPPLKHAGLGFKMPFRNLSRDRKRTFLNILGIALAFMLVLVSLALVDSMNSVFNFYFKDFVRYDADASYASPVSRAKASEVAGRPFVKAADPYLIAPSTFERNGRSVGQGQLQAVPRNTNLLGFYGTGGERVRLPETGALLSNWFRDGLGVRKGEVVTVVTPSGRFPVEVKGFVKQFGGLTVFADLSWVQSVVGTDAVNGVLVASAGPRGNELRNDVLKAPGVSGVAIPEFTRATLRSELAGVLYIFAGIMIMFAVAMALALVYNTISIAYLERETEVSVMRAMGTSLRRVAGAFTLENLLVALLAVIPGILAGYGLSVLMMKAFSAEFFDAPAVISGVSYVISILGVLLVVVLAELPSLRRAGHIDLAKAIRQRVA
jgi:putative ABC transport system permease protein